MSTDKQSTVRDTKRDAIYTPQVCVEITKAKFPSPASDAGDGAKLLPSDSTLESIRELERGDGFRYASLGKLWADLDS
ncbi:MAG: hypothetical protein F4065_09715 [Rhodothermaceae bacterium]|nr:hypothetical protein [Rhodothermaceae bacterium]MXZ57205.1 hypothetical protein [Rhodothermaceae bacterium]MYD67777.1 hypothetical protein [Rhodothermaceae bacterium]MYG45072.1 hypothetical protein [Rhodothermaceae bacterium]MYH13236.1 hypothetical protein [Rhodothermaceae bacterium]